MTKRPPEQLRNIAASVRDRLTQRARANAENVQLVLTRYAIERLLFRLSRSPYRDTFVLKGAMLFTLWTPTPYRASGDLDLLGFGDPSAERVARVFQEICKTEAPDDGVTFDINTLRAETTRPDDDYNGVRITLQATLAGARLPIQVDIGFGDAVTPSTTEVEYPSLLGMPAARLHAYPPETVVAEKFQAMVSLGMANSRLKDFYDLWAISGTFSFDGTVLSEAIRATFEHRSTPLPTATPIALTDTFGADKAKQTQWQAFLNRSQITLAPAPLPDVLLRIDSFVTPPTSAAAKVERFAKRWEPGRGWE